MRKAEEDCQAAEDAMATLNVDRSASEKKLVTLTAANPLLQRLIQQSTEDAAVPKQLEAQELLALQGRQKRLQVHFLHRLWGVQC